ncbi:hypothetical protein [Streptomyces anulatus]|uniref:hypothetical protein n=1 Tax=Streptomyces anulatus TaxID=1892 RepID=UPI002E318AB5|nr:hypothetical protein [Streptomyces anulatus]WTD23081.1 hypothetical protein OH737_00320 [Streptomyces anulatus]
MSGVHAKNTTGLQKTPAPVTDLLTDAWNTSAPEIPPTPVVDPAADRDVLADARSLTRRRPEPHTADPGDTTPPPANPPPANPPPAPGPVDKRGAEFLYRAGDLKKWARNRPRAGPTATDHPGPPTSANAGPRTHRAAGQALHHARTTEGARALLQEQVYAQDESLRHAQDYIHQVEAKLSEQREQAHTVSGVSTQVVGFDAALAARAARQATEAAQQESTPARPKPDGMPPDPHRPRPPDPVPIGEIRPGRDTLAFLVLAAAAWTAGAVFAVGIRADPGRPGPQRLETDDCRSGHPPGGRGLLGRVPLRHGEVRPQPRQRAGSLHGARAPGR